LGQTDKRHDGFGSVIFLATEVAFRLPDASDDLVAAARRLRAAVIPKLAELRSSYRLEADQAIDREPQLETLADDLRRFPVPDGRTLLEVATGFVAEGKKLHSLLSERGNVPKGQRARAAIIRSQTLGMINRLRDDLDRELAKDASLPRDLDQRVFGYLDTLGSMIPTGILPTAATSATSATEPTSGQ